MADPRDQAPVSADRSLSPASSRLQLAPRLRTDQVTMQRVLPMWAVASWCAVALGVALVALATWANAKTGPVLLAGVPLWIFGLSIAVLGTGGAIAGHFVTKPSATNVEFAPTQAQEWLAAEARVKQFRLARLVSLGLAVAGPVLAAIAYAASKSPTSLFAGLCLLLGFIGVIGFIASHLLLRLAVRTYIQSMVLALLERSDSGLLPPPGGHDVLSDDRVAPVLRTLDELLAALPDDAVHAFMARPEAADYLEIMDRLREAG